MNFNVVQVPDFKSQPLLFILKIWHRRVARGGTPIGVALREWSPYFHRVALRACRLAVSTVFQFSNFTISYEDNRWLGFIPPWVLGALILILIVLEILGFA